MRDATTTTYKVRKRRDGQYEIDRNNQPLGLVETRTDVRPFIIQDVAAENIDHYEIDYVGESK